MLSPFLSWCSLVSTTTIASPSRAVYLVSHRMMFPGAGVGIKRSNYNLGLVICKDFLFIYLSVLKRHKSVDIENPLIAVKYVHDCPFCVGL